MVLVVRDAARADARLIVKFIEDLADYEKLRHEAVATAADIERELFGPSPKVFCQIAEWDGQPAGFGLWFYTFSTFLGRHGIWLEDLFVLPDMRGHGIGKALLADLAKRCVRENLGRLEWAVLDWNEPSIEFYRSQGAIFMDDWRRCRVTGEALNRLGAK
jgi:GNAT superfamily N-acetyltransferase